MEYGSKQNQRNIIYVSILVKTSKKWGLRAFEHIRIKSKCKYPTIRASIRNKDGKKCDDCFYLDRWYLLFIPGCSSAGIGTPNTARERERERVFITLYFRYLPQHYLLSFILTWLKEKADVSKTLVFSQLFACQCKVSSSQPQSSTNQ